MKRLAPRERGAVAVEFGLALPILLVFVMTLLHLAHLVNTRQRLSEAANYAARAAAMRDGDTSQADRLVRERLGAMTEDCRDLSVNPELLTDDQGFESLKVNVVCQTKPVIDSESFENLGSRRIEVSAVMPL